MSEKQPDPVYSTDALKELQNKARNSRSGVVLTQDAVIELPPRLRKVLDENRRVMVDYTGNVSVQGE